MKYIYCFKNIIRRVGIIAAAKIYKYIKWHQEHFTAIGFIIMFAFVIFMIIDIHYFSGHYNSTKQVIAGLIMTLLVWLPKCIKIEAPK